MIDHAALDLMRQWTVLTPQRDRGETAPMVLYGLAMAAGLTHEEIHYALLRDEQGLYYIQFGSRMALSHLRRPDDIGLFASERENGTVEVNNEMFRNSHRDWGTDPITDLVKETHNSLFAGWVPNSVREHFPDSYPVSQSASFQAA